MSSLAVHTPLDANLAALGDVNADVADAIRATPPHPDLRLGPDAQGLATATLGDRRLCSAQRPLDEARRLVDGIDLVEHAVVVVMGFGLGHHVRRLAERLDRSGIIVVFEPDLALARAVFDRIDHAGWLGGSVLVWVTDPDDLGALASKLRGTESLVGQGVHVLDTAAGRARLGEQARTFRTTLGEFVTATRTSLVTTLMRSVETVRNQLLNLDHYAFGAGVADLENAADGRPAIVVAAGPSLARNIEQLAASGVRERCVIIAVQTTLLPLLEAGVKPHFVTALDYHEISRRFYERLDGHDLHDVALVAEPQAHPVILDSYPGPVRCCRSAFLATCRRARRSRTWRCISRGTSAAIPSRSSARISDSPTACTTARARQSTTFGRPS
ncbi:MAG: 6-hydroxymethylpterin diphosphokinase MptE-like protein [Planctomycetota bacterium]|jgi:hypothetical protein